MAISRPAGSADNPGDGHRWTPDGADMVLTDTSPYGIEGDHRLPFLIQGGVQRLDEKKFSSLQRTVLYG